MLDARCSSPAVEGCHYHFTVPSRGLLPTHAYTRTRNALSRGRSFAWPRGCARIGGNSDSCTVPIRSNGRNGWQARRPALALAYVCLGIDPLSCLLRMLKLFWPFPSLCVDGVDHPTGGSLGEATVLPWKRSQMTTPARCWHLIESDRRCRVCPFPM